MLEINGSAAKQDLPLTGGMLAAMEKYYLIGVHVFLKTGFPGLINEFIPDDLKVIILDFHYPIDRVELKQYTHTRMEFNPTNPIQNDERPANPAIKINKRPAKAILAESATGNTYASNLPSGDLVTSEQQESEHPYSNIV